MSNNRIWLSPPHLSGTEIEYIQQAIAQNWVAPYGQNLDNFELLLEKYFKTEDVALVNSGTAAIHLALICAGVQQGDEVIVPTLNFAGCVNPILYLKANPVFIDSEPATLNIDPARVEEAVKRKIAGGKKPKAIIGVHLFGIPCRINELAEIARKYEITLIEDAADAIGTTYNGKPVGTFGDYGVISFNGNKVITTSGGGVLLAKNAEKIAYAKYLSNQARSKGPHYLHQTVGYNYMMSNILAGIGCGQMEVLEERLKRRRQIYTAYKHAFQNTSILYFPNDIDGAESNRWLSVALVTGVADAKDVRDKLYYYLQEQNIESRPVWRPMHMQPAYEQFEFTGGSVAEDLYNRGICLPSGSKMTDDDLQRVIASIKHFFGSSYMEHNVKAEQRA